MAKNIDFMGATFPDVPSIRLPQHEGGLVSFDDTSDGNIVASDVAQGKIGYAQGQRVVGTAVAPTGSQTFTENGTFDVTSIAEAVINVAGGGGASNIARGTFTTPGSNNAVSTINIDYSGNGYPIMAVIMPKGGYLHPDGRYASTLQMYAIGDWVMVKDILTTPPDYNGTINDSVTTFYFNKSSSSNASQYEHIITQNEKTVYRTTGDVVAGDAICFQDNTTLKCANRNNYSRGLMRSTEYEYIIIYST